MVTAQATAAPGLLSRIKNSPAVDRVYMAGCRVLHDLLYRVSPTLTARHRYHREMGRSLPLDQPTTFDEKLFWLMLRWRHPLKSQCADKLEMRDYVERLGYGHLLVELHGVYERPSDINFSALPDQFALKCSHGCGFNIVCRDKSKLDVRATRRRLSAWMRQNYARVHGEVQYDGLRPRILCERFLDGGSGGPPPDFKLHCFQGRVHFTTVCLDRKPNGPAALYDHYDRDWRHQLAISRFGCHPERWVPQPECYAAMVEAAEALSRPFPYVRMDFYSVGGKPYLGEMTFTPAGCIDTGLTEEAQRDLGALIRLPEPI